MWKSVFPSTGSRVLTLTEKAAMLAFAYLPWTDQLLELAHVVERGAWPTWWQGWVPVLVEGA